MKVSNKLAVIILLVIKKIAHSQIIQPGCRYLVGSTLETIWNVRNVVVVLRRCIIRTFFLDATTNLYKRVCP